MRFLKSRTDTQSSEMQASIFCILVFFPTICICCDVLNYSSICVDEQMSITVSFEHSFNGTIFASLENSDGYIGNPNCSSENMEVTSSYEVTFNLSFTDCNTRIKRVEGKSHLQAINTVTIQYHPLIKTDLDCQITVKCDFYLSSDFLTSYLRHDFVSLISSKLDIMSGEKLFGVNGVGKKQFLVLNVTDGGKYDHLRIRKCYAHAKNVIDQLSTPDLLLEDNICSKAGFLNSLYLKYLEVDKSYSDLRDFSEVQNFEVSFSQKIFYITCAFDLCSDSCSNVCVGEMEVNKIRWSTVRTHRVELLDESFKGFRNRQDQLRKSMKMLYGRLLKLKNKQIVSKNSTGSKISKLGETSNVPNAASVESNSVDERQLRQVQFAEVDSEIPNASVSLLSQDEISSKNIANINLNGSEHFIKRSDVTEEAIDLPKPAEYDTITDKMTGGAKDAVANVIIEYSTEHRALNDKTLGELISVDSSERESALSGNDCLDASCSDVSDKSLSFRDLNEAGFVNDFFKTSSEKVFVIESNGSSFQSDDKRKDISVFTASNNTKSAGKDCVPYLKFASVTASLSFLCISFFLITLFLSLYIRKEKKRRNNVSYLYRHF